MPPLQPPQALLQLPVCVGEGEGKVDHAVGLLQASELEAHVEGAVSDPIVGQVPHSLPTCFALHLVGNTFKHNSKEAPITTWKTGAMPWLNNLFCLFKFCSVN